MPTINKISGRVFCRRRMHIAVPILAAALVITLQFFIYGDFIAKILSFGLASLIFVFACAYCDTKKGEAATVNEKKLYYYNCERFRGDSIDGIASGSVEYRDIKSVTASALPRIGWDKPFITLYHDVTVVTDQYTIVFPCGLGLCRAIKKQIKAVGSGENPSSDALWSDIWSAAQVGRFKRIWNRDTVFQSIEINDEGEDYIKIAVSKGSDEVVFYFYRGALRIYSGGLGQDETHDLDEFDSLGDVIRTMCTFMEQIEATPEDKKPRQITLGRRMSLSTHKFIIYGIVFVLISCSLASRLIRNESFEIFGTVAFFAAIALALYFLWFADTNATVCGQIICTGALAVWIAVQYLPLSTRVYVGVMLAIDIILAVMSILDYLTSRNLIRFRHRLGTVGYFLTGALTISVLLLQSSIVTVRSLFETGYFIYAAAAGVIIFIVLMLANVKRPPIVAASRLRSVFVCLFLALYSAFILGCQLHALNYVADTSEPVAQVVEIDGKHISHTGPARHWGRITLYNISCTIDGEDYTFNVGRSNYDRLEEGDRINVYRHEGALGADYYTLSDN